MVGATEVNSQEEAIFNNSNGERKNKDEKEKEKKEISFLNKNEEDQMEIYGFTYCQTRTVLTWIFYILSLGSLRLVYHWFNHWMLYSTHKQCSLREAQKVLIVDNYMGKYKSYYVRNVKTISTLSSFNNSLNDKVPSKFHVLLEIENKSEPREFFEMKVVWCKKVCYVWEPNYEQFFKLIGFDKNIPDSQLHSYRKGISAAEESIQRLAYGENVIRIPIQSIGELLVLEILNPFYIFQIFAMAVWSCEEYYFYIFAIIIMSVFGITSSILQTRTNQKNLHGTIHSSEMVTVVRNNKDMEVLEEVSSTNLVPGDIIIISDDGCEMQCDCVLLEGGACIVNESMLTGESVPVTKTPLPNSSRLTYNVKIDSNHTLYSGTKVIQVRHHGDGLVRALVIRTGFLTTKGQLVRSILHPPPADFKFDQDSYKIMAGLTCIALAGFIYTIIYKSYYHMPPFYTIIKGLDLFTIAVSPALPAAMTVGKLYALSRLKKKRIYCINSRVINVTGSIDCICFDKTGTLTEDGMDMWGVIPVKQNNLFDSENEAELDEPIKAPIDKELNRKLDIPLLHGMVTCHSVTVINDSIHGDPLDVKMFESTGWILDEKCTDDNISKYGIFVPTIVKSPNDNVEIGIVHQFQFSSSVQRMSVITKMINDGKNYTVFCKGSPEKIISLSKSHTVPKSIMTTLKVYTQQGYRVIAVGKRALNNVDIEEIKAYDRSEVEKDLDFIGLIILENRVKKETAGVIQILKRASMKIVMVTGDNMHTALSVACECGIIEKGHRIIDVIASKDPETDEYSLEYVQNIEECSRKISVVLNPKTLKSLEECSETDKVHYAVAGDSWAIIRQKFPEQLPRIARYGSVFARMSADQKQQLILELKALGYYVAMCGDGANDCGALKSAHAGVSLSEAEASVASPFTAKEPNISCMPKIIREGRAALITSFGIFKFIVGYSMVEFASTVLLYIINSNLTDLQFLYIDLFLIVTFAFSFGKTEAYRGPLVNVAPQFSLISLEPILSLVLQLLAFVIFQGVSWYAVRQFPWYIPFTYDVQVESLACMDNYAIFSISMFQYIIMAIVFSRGKPYRRPFYTNYPLLISIVLMTILSLYITLFPATWLVDALELVLPPIEFRELILFNAVANFIVSLIFEDVVINYLVLNFIREKKKKQKQRKDEELRLITSSTINIQKALMSLKNDGVANVIFEDENGKHPFSQSEVSKF